MLMGPRRVETMVRPQVGVLAATVLLLSWVAAISCLNVTYDQRALVIDGKRRFLQSGSIHYPRSTPEMWPGLMKLAKEGGLDLIQTYVFWDRHEPVKGTYNFAGEYDLVKFVKTVGAAGLYVNLRIGPYVCAEWNFGGFPSWLRFVPNIQLRTDNAAFKREMGRFVKDIVNLMKDNQLFAPQGGPIILAQIENEYGNIYTDFGNSAYTYLKWAADLAKQQDVGVPWIMCQQQDAPGDIINTCNGFYCDSFFPNSKTKPKFWTENWSGWFQNWGRQVPHRPVEDVAFSVARFFERGGSLNNYYMYHGGTNFGRTAGEWITTTYDYDAPIDEYGRARQPKWGHLKDLHAAIKLCEPALAAVDNDPLQVSLGPLQEAHIYADGSGTTLEEVLRKSTKCAAFLANVDGGWDSKNVTVRFNGLTYQLPPWSVSILPDCKTVAFNTAKVGSQTDVKKWVSSALNRTSESLAASTTKQTQNLQWETFHEPTPHTWGTSITQSGGLLEQINITKDTTDYLWYTTSVRVPTASEGTLQISGIKDTLHVFVNGQFTGGLELSFQTYYKQILQLKEGNNNISILSSTLGLQNYGAWMEKEAAGIEFANLTGLSVGDLQMSNQQWQYQAGMQGEQLQLFTEEGAKNVTWQSGTPTPKQALVWYKTTVDAPDGDSPVALDLGSMGKGQAWINGKGVGRFWTIPQSNLPDFPGSTCGTDCDYRGDYNPGRCTLGCGKPSQRWYHVPRDWLQPTGNLLVIFEEKGGDVSKVSLGTQIPGKVCAQVSEVHRTPAMMSYAASPAKSTPKLHLDCSYGYHISELVFASFGNPTGTCGSFQQGSCHANLSSDLLSLECLGKQQCSVQVSWTTFAVEDPCPEEPKSLAVEAVCSPTELNTRRIGYLP